MDNIRKKYEENAKWLTIVLSLSIIIMILFQKNETMNLIHWLEILWIEALLQLIIHCITKIEDIDDINTEERTRRNESRDKGISG